MCNDVLKTDSLQFGFEEKVFYCNESIKKIYSGKNLFLPAKTIFAGPVFSMEKTGFFHLLAKTCQPWNLIH